MKYILHVGGSGYCVLASRGVTELGDLFVVSDIMDFERCLELVAAFENPKGLGPEWRGSVSDHQKWKWQDVP